MAHLVENEVHTPYARTPLPADTNKWCGFCGRLPAAFEAPAGTFPAKELALCEECMDQVERAERLVQAGALAGAADGGYWATETESQA